MKILECQGQQVIEVDGDEGDSRLPPVKVVVSYKVQRGSAPALKAELHGRLLHTFGAKRTRIDLDDRTVMRGTLLGRWDARDPNVATRCDLVDIDIKGGLLVTKGAESDVVCDEFIIPLPSCYPLAIGGCATSGYGVRPGSPFSMSRKPAKGQQAWSSGVLRLLWGDGDIEIIIADSNNYWRRIFDSELTAHAAVMGVRRRDGGILPWQDIHEMLPVMEEFLGWLGRCRMEVAHVRGYRSGRVVYKEWRTRPHVTTANSWLPVLNHPDASTAIDVQGLLDGFARAWRANADREGTLHVALQCLRSKERPLGRDEASIMYLDHVVRACFLLLSETRRPNNARGNYEKFRRCCEALHVEDVLPGWDDNADAPKELEWLWGEPRRQAKPGCLSTALANLRNKLTHIDEPKNARLVMKLPATTQRHLTEVALWLAELLMLKIVGYNGAYHDRLTMQTEIVPWATKRAGGRPSGGS